jgi:Cu2+-exporting ATPase
MPMSVGALLMSMSTVVVALNAQLLRRLELSPDSNVNAIGPAVSKKAVRL